MAPNGDNGDDGDGEEHRVLSDREAIREWADERGSRPVVSATPEGSLNLEFTDEDVEGRELDWDSFFSMYESSDVEFVVDEGGRERFVDKSRIPGTGDDDQVHPDADSRTIDDVDRDSQQIEGDAQETANPDNHRDEEPFQS